MPKMMKKAQQIKTMLPMGFRDVMSVSTTSFNPGALLITLESKKERERKRGGEGGGGGDRGGWRTVKMQRDSQNRNKAVLLPT